MPQGRILNTNGAKKRKGNTTLIGSVHKTAPGIFEIRNERGQRVCNCTLPGSATLLGFTASTITFDDGQGYIRIFNEQGQPIASHPK